MAKLLDDIFECIEDDELKILARITNPQIPGFSRKRIVDAPIPRLKKAVRQEMNRIREPDKLLEMIIKEKKPHYDENEAFEDFWWKLNNDKNVTKLVQLLLLYFLHPEKYEEYSAFILQTEGETRLVADSQQIPFAKRLKMQLDLVDISKVTFWLREEFDKVYPKSTEDNHDKVDDALKPWLEEQIHDGFSCLGKGCLLTRYFHAQDAWRDWDDAEKEAWLHLVIRDAALYAYSLHAEIKALQSQLEELQNHLQMTVRKQSQEQEQWQNRFERQQQQLDKLTAELRETVQKWEQTVQQLKECEANAEKLEKEKNRLETIYQNLEQEVMGMAGWLHNDVFVLVTRKRDPLLHRILSSEQLCVLNEISLQKLEEWMEEALPDVMYYIDISDLSTKEQFELEAKLKSRGIHHRMISGSPLTMLRKIIGYLEGVA